MRALLQQSLDALESLQGGCTDSDDGTVEAITVWCPELIDALREALAQPDAEPVMWQYRWTNPSVNPNVRPEELEWKPLELKGRTEEGTLRDLVAYRFDGRPCYEVRALFATPQARPAPAVPDGWVMVPRDPSIAMCIAGDGVRHNEDDATKTPAVYRAMIAAAPGSAQPAPAAPAVPAVQIGMKASTWGTLSSDAQTLILEAGQRAVDKTKARRVTDAAARAMTPIPLGGSAAPIDWGTPHDASGAPWGPVDATAAPAVRDEIELIEAVLAGYPPSMARSDALRACRVLRGITGDNK